MRRDYITTFLAEAFVLLSALLVYRIVASAYGTSGFAEYAVARRTLTLLLPLGVVGLDIGLARLIAYAAADRPREARSYLVAALPIAGTGVALASATLLLFAPFFAQLFFGDATRTDLVASLPILLIGATAHVLVYGNLRGRNLIGQANAVMIGNHAIVPLATLLLSPSLAVALMTLGASWLTFSALVFVLTPKVAVAPRRLAVELFRFGSRRVSGDFVQLLFFALPVIITAQIGGLTEAGIVAFGMTALGMVGSALTPIGFVLLPRAARDMERGSITRLREHVLDILRLVVPSVIAGVAVLEVFAGPIIERYLGADFVPAASALRIILVGALPWSAFVVLRSVIDARHERAINARNLALSFALFLLLATPGALIARDTTLVLVAFVAGLFALGALTAVEAYRVLWRDAAIA